MSNPSHVTLVALCAVVIVAVFIGVLQRAPSAGASPQPFTGTAASPQVKVVVDLHDPVLHPRQVVYDPARNGLWFWTSTENAQSVVDNRLYFYDIALRHLNHWSLPNDSWSSQLLAGLAVGADRDVWIGWNHDLVRFNPATGMSTRYLLPARTEYPLPSSVLGDLPTDLGIAGLAAARDGTIWIARYGALSLTSFTPGDQAFHEYPLSANAGDPAELAIAPDGHIIFTIDLSADHPGFANERIGDFDPGNGRTVVLYQGARSLAISPQGDVYVALY